MSDIASPAKYSVVGGPFGSKLGGKDYVESGVPVLRGANLPQHKRIDLSDLVYVTADKVERDLKGNLAYPGDIVVTQRGTLGQVGLIPEDCVYPRLVVSQSQMKLTVDTSKVDRRFVYYALKSPVSFKQINDLAISSGVPHINLEIFRGFRIPVPDLETQVSIGRTLSAFDDLIENNRRRIEILEEMARLLYREWFVHFRFPGHEDVEMVDSELGPIPEGWEVVDFADCCSRLQAGGTPKRKEPAFWSSHHLDWYKTGELRDSFLFESEEGISAVAEGAARVFDPGTILMAIYGSPTVGRLGVLTRRASCNQAALGVVADDGVASQTFLYYKLWELRAMFNSIAQGAAQQNISKEKVAKARIALPARSVVHAFDERVLPIWDLRRNLTAQNRILREARDLLLPRLVSGELDVSELDIEGVMA